MKVEFTHIFIKRFKKRIQQNSATHNKFDQRVLLFEKDSSDSLLKDHKLSGKLKDHRAFSITGEIRIVYYIHHEIAYFVDIGTHNQVYGK